MKSRNQSVPSLKKRPHRSATNFPPPRFAIVVIIVIPLLFGCSKQPKPSKTDITQELQKGLPGYLKVDDVTIDAISNSGNDVNPQWDSRFRMIVEIKSDTYVVDGSETGITFVRLANEKGSEIEIFGRSQSVLYSGSWRTSIAFDGDPVGAAGLLKTSFGPNKVIVRGSQDEKNYLKELEDKRRVAIDAARRREEVTRNRAEEARKERELAGEQRLKMLKNAPDLLVGTWRNNKNDLFTFNADRTFTRINEAQLIKETGTWKIDGDIILFTFLRANQELVNPPLQRGSVIQELTNSTYILADRDNPDLKWTATRVK